jgi:hypothetical protein
MSKQVLAIGILSLSLTSGTHPSKIMIGAEEGKDPRYPHVNNFIDVPTAEQKWSRWMKWERLDSWNVLIGRII